MCMVENNLVINNKNCFLISLFRFMIHSTTIIMECFIVQFCFPCTVQYKQITYLRATHQFCPVKILRKIYQTSQFPLPFELYWSKDHGNLKRNTSSLVFSSKIKKNHHYSLTITWMNPCYVEIKNGT